MNEVIKKTAMIFRAPPPNLFHLYHILFWLVKRKIKKF